MRGGSVDIEVVPFMAGEPAHLLGRFIEGAAPMIWEPTINPEAYAIESQLVLPDGIKLFDIHINPSGSLLFFLEIFGERSTLAIAPGDDPVGRFHKLLEDTIMAKEKEIGMSPKASKKAKAYDEKMDKKMGYKEGGPADLKADKKAMKMFPAKKKGK